ncbi:MAG: lipoyl(octanoyl) transferase LipB [Armatimonadota bacterium]
MNLPESGPPLEIVHLWRGGPIPYPEGLELQRSLVRLRAEDAVPDTLLLLEHAPVVTHGKLADPIHRRVDAEEMRSKGIDLFATDRGGDHTYHGPGQLVGYPIVRLEGAGRDVRSYVRTLEQVLIDVARGLGVASAGREDFHAGLWAEGRYLAAIGVRVSRGIASHGFALNVDRRVHHGFGTIVACGVSGRTVTSLEEETGRTVAMAEAAAAIEGHFPRCFGHRVADVRDRI